MKRHAFALALAVLPFLAAASPTVVFSSLGSPTGDSYMVSPGNVPAFRFTPTQTGALTGFRLSMFNAGSVGPTAYALELRADDGGQVGASLASFEGLSAGVPFWNQAGELSSVTAHGEAITAGTAYWLLATSAGSLAWTAADVAPSPAYLNGRYWSDFGPGAFEVEAQAQPVPEPVPLAALGLGLASLIRRGRRA